MTASPQHATLVASTVATLTFDEDFDAVEVLNVDGAAAVYFRFDGTNPTVAGTSAHAVPAVAGATAKRRLRTSGPTSVKLISAGTPKVSVRGIRSGDV